MRDDGTVPRDNPYFMRLFARWGSTRHTVWSIGHRTGQGLRPSGNGDIWNSEWPRGGDELNLIEGGGFMAGYTNGSIIMATTPSATIWGSIFRLRKPCQLSFAGTGAQFDFIEFSFSDWNGDALIGSLKAGTFIGAG